MSDSHAVRQWWVLIRRVRHCLTPFASFEDMENLVEDLWRVLLFSQCVHCIILLQEAAFDRSPYLYCRLMKHLFVAWLQPKLVLIR